MTTTDNHGYNAPERGTENWDVPLNENFAALDAEMEVRDVEANRGNYTPKAGAKFLSIDTGIVSIGDGTEWQEAMALPRFNSPPSGESEWAGNVVMGHPSNRIDSDAAGGATIAGGGLGLDDGPNVVEGAFGTIGGGAANSVSNPYGTVSGGFLNTAGEGAAVGGGAENTASAGATVGGGEGNTASALYATVSGGNNNTASEFVATVAGGSNNTASGRYSFAAGSEAKARHRGSFVWNDSSDAEFGSTGDNQFLIRATGGVGIGTNEPRNPLDVRADPSGGARIVNHVMVVENTSDEGEGDVLALKTNSRDPGSGANLITFKSANADIGAIEGDGGGGVTLKSGGADYAELLPRRNPDETFKPGAVVGLTRGKLIRDTAGADRVMVVSEQASVVGNDPGEDAREDYTPVAFVGQVRTKVRGRVESGDLIVPSGEADGTGRAIPPEEWGPDEHDPVVGQAWEDDADDGATRVTVAVGLDRLDAVAGRLRAASERTATLATRVEEQAAAIADLEARFDAMQASTPDLVADGGGPADGGEP